MAARLGHLFNSFIWLAVPSLSPASFSTNLHLYRATFTPPFGIYTRYKMSRYDVEAGRFITVFTNNNKRLLNDL